MIISEIQLATLSISLSALGQVALEDNEVDTLIHLKYLLEQAQYNVNNALELKKNENKDRS